MLPAEDALPVALTSGWPEPLPGSRVILRETGITLGAVLLDDDEWTIVRSSAVYSVRIDDHPRTDRWTSTELGRESQHEFEIPTSPVLVPSKALVSSLDLTDWVWSTHGALGRLLLWDDRRTWWIAQEPDLELMFLCAQPTLFRNESDELSWWDFGMDEGRREVNELCVRYDVKRP